MILSQDQENALNKIESFLTNEDRIFILKGGAGTGKTTLIKEIINKIKAKEIDCSLMAPTGRAARILTEKTNFESRTIHANIYHYKYQDNRREDSTFKLYFDLNENKDSLTHIYIIDESSMIGNNDNENEMLQYGSGHLLGDLLTFVDDKNYLNGEMKRKIIFIGDECQLPPVSNSCDNSPTLNSENLFSFIAGRKSSFVLSSPPKAVTLTEVHRQKSGNGILDNATYIRKQIKENEYTHFNVTQNQNCSYLASKSQLIKDFLSNYKLGKWHNPIIINHTNKQVKDDTKIIREHYGFISDTDLPWDAKKSEINPKEQLVVVNNNFKYDLFNGDLCIVKKVGELESVGPVSITKEGAKKESIYVDLFFRDITIETFINNKATEQEVKIIENLLESDERSLTKDEYRALNAFAQKKHKHLGLNTEAFQKAMYEDPYLNALQVKYGYSITCHKAQGGEWKEAYIDLETRLATMEAENFKWVYTAITRAKNKLYFTNLRERKSPVQDLDINIPRQDDLIENNTQTIIPESITNNPFECKLYNFISQISTFEITNIRPRGEYHRQYIFNENISIDIHNNADGKITSYISNQEEARNIIEELKTIEHIIIDETEFEFSNSQLERIYQNFNASLQNTGIATVKIKHYQNHEIYYFEKGVQVAIVKFWYNQAYGITRLEPVTNNGLTIEITEGINNVTVS